MNIFTGLEKIVEKDFPLKKMTWFGLGGNAEYFITPQDTSQLQDVVKRCAENQLDIKILGFGSNILVKDEGVKGAVVKLQAEEFAKVIFDSVSLTAGAGANMSKLVLECVRKGLSGLEGLTGIPGSVGGAVKMNAGGNFGDIAASVKSVTLMARDGSIFEKAKPELSFNYRTSNITAPIILSANLEMIQADPAAILRTTKEIWIYKKNAQPLNTKNAGCVFKNTRGVSAGALIDRAGLKGLQIGGARVSEKHANFILAEESATASDVLRIIDAVRQRVREAFDIELEIEIEIW